MAAASLRHPCGVSVRLRNPRVPFAASSPNNLRLFHTVRYQLSYFSMLPQHHSFMKSGGHCFKYVRPAALQPNISSPTPQDDDVILLDVQGMTCSGCTASVKRILEGLELRDIGVQTIWGKPSEIGKTFESSIFDAVLDNNGKDIDSVKPVADWAKTIGAQQFLYISSAGIYKPTDEPPHVEGDIVKSDASHVAVEDHIRSLSFNSFAVFRPQYMIGSGNNKDCEEWFFDRIVRDRPVPIPGSGMQVTNIAHVRDLSSMLLLAFKKPFDANGNIFNAVSDRAITFHGLVKLCARAAGKEAKIVHYDPKSLNIDAKKAFPFRNMHFYAEPRAAKDILGWESSTNLPEDLKERFEEYIAIGRDKKDMKFDLDDKILGSSMVAITV